MATQKHVRRLWFGLVYGLVMAIQVQAQTLVGGTINVDTTWTRANEPYEITSDVVVDSGATLTIESGVVVRGRSNTGLRVSDGHLAVDGEPTLPILFTSVMNSGPGQWEGLTISGANATASIYFCSIHNAGQPNDLGVGSGIAVNLSPMTYLHYCTIVDCSGSPSVSSGLYITGNASVEVVESEFLRCGDELFDFALRDDGAAALTVDQCSFIDNAGRVAQVSASNIGGFLASFCSGNGFDRARVLSGSTVNGGVMRSQGTGFEGFELSGGDLLVPSATGFTVEAGVSIFGISASSEIQVQGRLECLGTMEEPILMTSVDDSSANNWGGVSFNGGNSSGLMRWTTVRHGGGGNAFALRSNLSVVSCPDFVMEHCTISDIETGGTDYGFYNSNSTSRFSDCVFARCGAPDTLSAGLSNVSGSSRIEDCVFDSNAAAGLQASSGNVSVSCTSFANNAVGLRRTGGMMSASECSFEGNTEFAAENTNAAQLNICCSWWGDSSGPDAPGGSGSGDKITNNVGYIPFSVTDDSCGFDCLMGDTNNDGNINLADLNLVLANFGNAVEIGTGGDVNDDGVVNLADLNLVLANFGTACEAST